jgi:propionyl-CoA synthetase
MEEVLAGHPAVAECAVIGVKDELKGQRPVALLVLKAGVSTPQEQVETEAVQRVREAIGPVAALKNVHVVERLPKTRSGKILRRTLRQIADGDRFETPATLDDPAILDAIAQRLGAG